MTNSRSKADSSIVDLIDSISTNHGRFKMDSLPDDVREAILRAVARGVPPGTISEALRPTPHYIDPKAIFRYIRLPEVAARIEQMKKGGT